MNIFDFTIEVDGIKHCGYCGGTIDDSCQCHEASKYTQSIDEIKYILEHIPKLKYVKREKLVMGL